MAEDREAAAATPRGSGDEDARSKAIVADAERLRADEQRFRLICRATNDALWDWDLVTNALWWSDGFEALFGYEASEVEPGVESWSSRIHPEDREAVLVGIHAAIAAGSMSWRDEYRFLRKDGRYAHVVDRGYVVRDDAGRPLRMVGGMTDDTERRRAETRIREQAALLDAANDAIVVRDLEGIVTYWNRAAERVYGAVAVEAVGRRFADVARAASARLAEGEQVVRVRGEWAGELVHTRDAGREIVVATQCTLVRGERGEPRAILSIGTDVTERKRYEAQARHAQRMESVATLAAGIAHDLNNVLTPIMMSIDLLGRDDVTLAMRREMLVAVSDGARRGAAMVRQLLAFTRGVEGKRLVVWPKDLVLDVTRAARKALPDGVELRTAVQSGVSPVLGDEAQLHQVLLNLVINARDAMPGGGLLTIEVGHTALAAPDAPLGPQRAVYFRVSDTGEGIAASARERIFEPFFTTKAAGSGSGLGLSMALAIVKSHGGTLDAHSAEGVGTTFEVRLPALTLEEASVYREASALTPRGKNELVLVVDDEAAIRSSAGRTLTASGYRVVTASNGVEATAAFAEHAGEVAVVVTDMSMPVMDGPATIRALRAVAPGVPIVATSGFSAAWLDATPSVEGANLFLAKPYTADELLRALRDVLERPGLRRSAPES